MNAFDDRQAIRELLPWYENGTLPEREREAVRALLATDLEANRQRRELRALREAIVDDTTLATDMAVNLRALQTRLDAPVGAKPNRLRWFACAAALLLALGGSTFFAGLRVGTYHTLSTPAATPLVPADFELIRVDVARNVDATLLLSLAGDPQARVLLGPSEHGVATLVVPRDHAAVVMARLNRDPRLRFVAPVPR
ncbi:MAG TPA: hypothetical protein VFB32_04195 [Rudaea sp.]|nr:hypothetical protein [Rudaea sp.]